MSEIAHTQRLMLPLSKVKVTAFTARSTGQPTVILPYSRCLRCSSGSWSNLYLILACMQKFATSFNDA